MNFASVFCAQARGKKRQSGLFPGSHVKILDRKTSSPASPATEDVSISPFLFAYGFLMASGYKRDSYRVKLDAFREKQDWYREKRGSYCEKWDLSPETGLLPRGTWIISQETRLLLRETWMVSREAWIIARNVNRIAENETCYQIGEKRDSYRKKRCCTPFIPDEDAA